MSGPLLTEDQRRQLAEHRAERIDQYVAEARKAVEQIYRAGGQAVAPLEPNPAVIKSINGAP